MQSAEVNQRLDFIHSNGYNDSICFLGGADMKHKILVVDDETMITELLSDHLGDEGYEVMAAAGAADALKLLPKNPRRSCKGIPAYLKSVTIRICRGVFAIYRFIGTRASVHRGNLCRAAKGFRLRGISALHSGE